MLDVYENRVRFAETDAQGIVFYGTYVTYQDEAVTEYLDAIGFGYEEFLTQDWDVHVVGVEMDYRGSATFRDKLVHGVRVKRLGTTSVEFEYECRDAETDEVLVEGGVTHVVVDGSGTPTAVPDALVDAIVEAQEEPPEGLDS